MTGQTRVWPVKPTIRPDIVRWPAVILSPECPICCSQYCILLTRTIWRELVNLCTNHSFVTIEQCTYLFCWRILAQQSDFIRIWWISGLFLWWYPFYFCFGCVCIWRESNVRWPGSCVWNRTFNVPLDTWNFRIFVEWKAPLESPYVGGRLLVL